MFGNVLCWSCSCVVISSQSGARLIMCTVWFPSQHRGSNLKSCHLVVNWRPANVIFVLFCSVISKLCSEFQTSFCVYFFLYWTYDFSADFEFIHCFKAVQAVVLLWDSSSFKYLVCFVFPSVLTIYFIFLVCVCVVTVKFALQGSGCASMIFISFSILHYVAEV